MDQTHPSNHCHSQPYACIRKKQSHSHCLAHGLEFCLYATIFKKKSAHTTLVRPLHEYSSSVWDPHTKTLVNKIEMIQRRAARFCHNDDKTIEKGCMSEMIGKLNLEPLTIRRTNRRFTIFHKAINGHLALPIGHLQPDLLRTRHLNSQAYNAIHTSKDCYKYSFFPRTIKDWNSLPDKHSHYQRTT